MKRILAVLLASAMLAVSAVGCGGNSENGDASKDGNTSSAASTAESTGEDASDVLIGSCIYKFDDTFMTGVRNEMEARAKTLGATVELVDSQNKQPTQNEQVDTFITKQVSALAVNPVDRTAAGPLIEKAKTAGIPITFLNREPEAADMKSYDKVYYVGAKAEESGTMSGEIIAEYFDKNPDADKNKDHKIQFVMLQGEPGHQDATLRTEYSQKALKDKGWEGVPLQMDTAYWDKAKATDLMNNMISAQGLDKIEAVLCNNDDMALGAVEALKAAGYNKGDKSKYIPVVGVDATSPALEAMKDGSMLGTVLNDGKNQGIATVNICTAAAQGKEVNKTNIGYDVTDGKYVWIPYVKVTQDNYKEFMA